MNDICQTCGGGGSPCSTWASGRLNLAAPEDRSLLSQPGTCTGSAREGGSRWRDPCQLPAMSRADFLARLSGRTVVFAGDSLMRQLYLRTIAWLRGQRNVVDVPFHNDAVYLVATPLQSSQRTHDALLPLWEFYRSNCALARLEGRDSVSACRAARHSSMAVSARPIQNREVKEIAIAVRKVAGWLDEQKRANWSRVPHTRLIFRFHPGYLPELFAGIGDLRPHILIAGALGGHVPCWSNGKPGNRCSIENVPERMHESFWSGARAHLTSNNRLRLFTWVTFPFAHTGSRYQNGNYTHFNERARHEINLMRSRQPAASRPIHSITHA